MAVIEEPQLKLPLVTPDISAGARSSPVSQGGLPKSGRQLEGDWGAVFSSLVSTVVTAANPTSQLEMRVGGREEKGRRTAFPCSHIPVEGETLSLWADSSHVPLCDRGGDWLNNLPS